MIKPEMVPKDAMYAAWKAMNAGMTLNDAIAAALNAWPGMATIKEDDRVTVAAVYLPLHTEASDDQ